jgi:hypothetical protein
MTESTFSSNVVRAVCAALFAVALLAACADRSAPEEQVRAVLDAVEQAAEARDVADVMQHVADDYGDDNAFDKAKLRDFVRGYFVINPSLELVVRIDSIDFPSPDLARVQIGVASVARRGTAEGALDAVNLDYQALRVELVRESGDWFVRRVDRAAVQ